MADVDINQVSHSSAVHTDLNSSLSLLAPLRELYERSPQRVLFTFVDSRGVDQESLTVAQLVRSAEGVANSLRQWGMEPGERAVLVYPPGLDFVRALVGCLIAGVIPVPAYPPDPMRPASTVAGFASVVNDSGARAVLTNGFYDRMRKVGAFAGWIGLGQRGAQWPSAEWYRTDRGAVLGQPTLQWHIPAGPDEPAVLQYTSGSTTDPRGVLMSHQNLRDELAQNATDLGLGKDTVAAIWIPQYHDLCLVSFILSALVGNGHTYLMSPMTFLQRPAVWFDVLSRVGATHTAAPNFGYELAVRRTTGQMRERWRLNNLQVAMTAAEPIRKDTVDRFVSAFAVSGLRSDAIYGAYGLAEHMSATMGGRRACWLDRAMLEAGTAVVAPEADPATTLPVFSCGRVTKPDAKLRIVEPESGVPCPDGTVGEIWLDSSTKAQGYLGRPVDTQRIFHAKVADGDPRTYLRTGDLGFLYNDELFVTGRLKDLIIINGRNIYPQDIEDTIRDCHPLIRPGGVVAFEVPADPEEGHRHEGVGIFVETREERPSATHQEDIVEAVRRRIFDEHKLSCRTIVVGTTGLVRKTTSGKVRRDKCRTDFLSAEVVGDSRTLQIWRLEGSAHLANEDS